MTTASAISKFDILLDKYGSPYFEESEKLEFLNMAQLEVLNRMVPDSLGGVVNFEMDTNVTQVIRPLVYNNNYAIVDIGYNRGSVTYSAINQALVTISQDLDASVFRIMSVGIGSAGDYKPVRYVKHNNVFKYNDNVFKKPSVNNFSYTLEINSGGGAGFTDGIVIYPLDTSKVANITVIKNPKIMTAGNSPDWDDYVMNQVILQAVKLAGVPLRDEEIIRDARLTGFQSAQ